MADGNEQWRLFKDFNKRDANRGVTRNWCKWEISPDGRLQDKAQTQLLRDTIKMNIRIHSGGFAHGRQHRRRCGAQQNRV